MNTCRIVVLAFLFIGASCAGEDKPAPSEFRIAGYFPEWHFGKTDLAASAKGLTELMIFSVEPAADGSLDLKRLASAPWEKFAELKATQKTRLFLCVGGWERGKHFPAVAQTPKLRAQFVASALAILQERKLDGLDLDWEHPKNAAEETAYGQLIVDLHAAFKPHGFLVSVTIAAWQKLPAEGFAAADLVQIMSYDHDGKHATFEAAQRDVKSLLDRNVPREKLVLGVPFYGRQIKQRNKEMGYAEIVAKFNPAPDADEAEGYYFNGLDMIRRKTRYAREEKLGGIMFWELGQDAAGEKSLLSQIVKEAK